MKKVLAFFVVITVILFSIYFLFKHNSIYRVFKIETPNKIYIDLNNNHIFDEKEPVIINNIYFIEKDKDYSSHPVLKNLNEDEKFFLSYMVMEQAKLLLNKRYVTLSDDERILLSNKADYSKLLINTKYAYFDEASQKALVDNVKNINLNDYVIYNPHSKKYHKLNCPEGKKLGNYKIIKLSELKESNVPCKLCHLNQNKTNKVFIDNRKNQSINSAEIKSVNNVVISGVSDSFKKENIIVFFIDLNSVFKPSNKCTILACKTLKEEINNAKETIDFAIYGINNQPEIVNALVNAKNRGVKVRWIYDINKSSTNYYEDNEKLAKLITSYKTDEEYENTNPTAIMHNKFFIFDNKKVWTGSSNITSTDLSGFNSNYAMLIDSQDVAKIYTQEFEQMYNGAFHKYKKDYKYSSVKINNETVLKPVFSPQHNSMNTEIIPIINKAEKYIYIPMFFITHKACANALIQAHKRGVEIKVIHDATNSHANNTTHKILRNAGIKVKTENYAGKIHSKALIVDDKISLIGSMNYTNSGNNKNDENVVIIYDRDITKYLKQTFLYLWNKIPEKYEKFDPRAESKESVGSCSDGIDNNFDNKIDEQDDGCKVK